MKQLDDRPVPFQVDGAQLDTLDAEQPIGRLALDFQFVNVAEAERFLVEAKRTLRVRDAETNVGKAQRAFP